MKYLSLPSIIAFLSSFSSAEYSLKCKRKCKHLDYFNKDQEKKEECANREIIKFPSNKTHARFVALYTFMQCFGI